MGHQASKKAKKVNGLHRCQNCDGLWDESDLLGHIPDLRIRVFPGEPMPAGECPECRALCHPFEGDTAHRCPRCQEGVELRRFEAVCRIPISPDGWALTDGPLDTSEEAFACRNACGDVPFEWVFRQVSRKEALELMDSRKGLHPFTVVGVYRDNAQRYATHVMARNPEHAEGLAQLTCAEDNGGAVKENRSPALLQIAGVIEGDVDMADSSS